MLQATMQPDDAENSKEEWLALQEPVKIRKVPAQNPTSVALTPGVRGALDEVGERKDSGLLNGMQGIQAG